MKTNNRSEKKIPMRTCIGCGSEKAKMELIRIVRTPEGCLQLDRTARANGRGAYLCDNAECLEKAFRSKALNKAFSMPVSKETEEALREAFLHG